jgi:hypothetical protein
MRSDSPPVTFYVDPEFARAELSYADMVVLSGLFRRWALYEYELPPDQCTRLICWSVDYEQLAKWVGPSWVASEPTDTLIAFLAGLERRSSTIIDASCFFQIQRTDLAED